MPNSVFYIYGISMYPSFPINWMREVYLIKGRAYYVANNTDEAVTCWAIKNVKWANEQCYEKLKMEFHYQYQPYTIRINKLLSQM